MIGMHDSVGYNIIIMVRGRRAILRDVVGR